MRWWMCGGRGNSGGEFEPFVNDGRDGYDVDGMDREAAVLRREGDDVGEDRMRGLTSGPR